MRAWSWFIIIVIIFQQAVLYICMFSSASSPQGPVLSPFEFFTHPSPKHASECKQREIFGWCGYCKFATQWWAWPRPTHWFIEGDTLKTKGAIVDSGATPRPSPGKVWKIASISVHLSGTPVSSFPSKYYGRSILKNIIQSVSIRFYPWCLHTSAGG